MNVARYRYVLRVASVNLLEQLHREAFATLDVEQRERLRRRLLHDLEEGRRPEDASPAELARTAVAAQEGDRSYLVRVLRRPGYGVTEGHAADAASEDPQRSAPRTGRRASGGAGSDLLFAGSMLDAVAAVVIASDAATEVMPGFPHSPEAAQVNPAIFARGPVAPDRWGPATTDGYDMGRDFDRGRP